MTLAPTNKAIRSENCAKQNLDTKIELTVMVGEFIDDVRIVLLSKKHEIL